MKIPWTQLRSKSVNIEIRDLFILLGPSLLGAPDADGEEEWLARHKEERLTAMEVKEMAVCNGMDEKGC